MSDRAVIWSYRGRPAVSSVDVSNAPNTPDRTKASQHHVLMDDGFSACDRTMLLSEPVWPRDMAFMDVDSRFTMLCQRPGCRSRHGLTVSRETVVVQRQLREQYEEWQRKIGASSDDDDDEDDLDLLQRGRP